MGENESEGLVSDPAQRVRLSRAIIKRQLSYMQKILMLEFDITGKTDGTHIISTESLDWNGAWELQKMWDAAVGRAPGVELSAIKMRRDKDGKVECKMELRCSNDVFGTVEEFDWQLFSVSNEDARILTSWTTDETHEKGLWELAIPARE